MKAKQEKAADLSSRFRLRIGKRVHLKVRASRILIFFNPQKMKAQKANMTLEKYRKARDFNKTPEPLEESGDEKENIFVVQRHDASHLHFDFRLSLDGVLKSWAVPKEPPREVGPKRLAIKTEDHPLSYAIFTGTIPEGQYGAGTVEIWDAGTFELKERLDSKIVFHLSGRKLKGKYVILKFPKAGDDGWLFFKAD